MSAVRYPAFTVALTASSILAASDASFNEYRSNIAADEIAPIGFAISSPVMSGAEPWIGSYNPTLPPMLADASSHSDPEITAASSLSTSPNRFSVTTTSYRVGVVIICIANESTYA